MVEFIQQYGYLGIALGCFLEGETVLVLGSFAARADYLDLQGVILAAFVGSFLNDQLFFYLGRRYGDRLLKRWPSFRMRAEKVKRLLREYDALFVISFRFIYGIRTVSPFAIGMSGMRPRRFLMLNAFAALLWAASVGSVSYAIGGLLQAYAEQLEIGQVALAAAVIATGVLIYALHLARTRARTRRYLKAEQKQVGDNRPDG